MRVGAVIVAAGRGKRFGSDRPKQFEDLAGAPLLSWSVRAFARHPAVGRLVVALPAEWVDPPPDWMPEEVTVLAGGVARGDSVRAGVGALGGTSDVVLVHDGARPFPSSELISRVIGAGGRRPAVPVIGVHDTVKRVDSAGRVVQSLPRAELRRVQTPQGFPAEVLARTHAPADDGVWRGRRASEMTDDAMLCEALGIEVATVEGDPSNLKVTTPRDLALARWMVETGMVLPP